MSNTVPDYGRVRPISETRSATIKTVYEVDCAGCEAGGHGGIYLRRFDNADDANRYAAEHNATHSKTMGECCMRATGCVCSCGNVLV